MDYANLGIRGRRQEREQVDRLQAGLDLGDALPAADLDAGEDRQRPVLGVGEPDVAAGVAVELAEAGEDGGVFLSASGSLMKARLEDYPPLRRQSSGRLKSPCQTPASARRARSSSLRYAPLLYRV